MERLAAIVLAAGLSSRMGSFKPLAKLGDHTLLECAVAAFTAVGVDDVLVVTGHRADEVAALARRCGARAVRNGDYERGMYSSVRTGVAALDAAADRFFLLPVDCPLVRPETVGRLARCARGTRAEVVLPVSAGVAGHPPLVSTVLREEIVDSDPPDGLRALLAAHAGATIVCEVDDPNVTTDADTPDALDELCRRAAGEDLPGEDRCREVLREHGASAATVAHSEAVAAVGAALANALDERGQHLCLPLVVAGALLHDVARARPRHAEAGGRLLDELGYRRLAPLVRRHMDVGPAAGADIGETEVVYLADKLVLGDRIVTVEERFAARMRQLAGRPDALAGARARLAAASRVRAGVERVLGHKLGPAADARPGGAAA